MINTRSVSAQFALVAVTAVALTGCTVTSSEPRSDTASDLMAGSSNHSIEHLEYGQTMSAPLSVAVTPPREFVTSQFASPPGSNAWGVDVEFTNHGTDTVSPVMVQVGGATDGRADTEVMDSAKGYQGLVTAPPIAPGERLTVPVGFSGQGDSHVVTVKLTSGHSAVFK